MNNVEYLRLMRIVQAAWPTWKLTADSFEFAEGLLARYDLDEAINAVRELACEYVEYPPASLGVIRKRIEDKQIVTFSVDELFVRVVAWLECDELWRRYDDDRELNYGLDRWCPPEPPPGHPELPISILSLIDLNGGPEALYEALVLRGDTTSVAQFKKALSTVPKPTTRLQSLPVSEEQSIRELPAKEPQ